MNRDVKPRRTYEGAARQARTRRTRAAVIEAARSLFVERGYAATTIEAISDRAHTPQATVYRLFSSKLGILRAVLDVSIGGDDEAVAMADRPQVRVLLSDAKTHQQQPRTPRAPSMTRPRCSERSLSSATRASAASRAPSPAQAACERGCESATPAT